MQGSKPLSQDLGNRREQGEVVGCVYMASWLELARAEAVGATLKTVQVMGGAHHNEDPKQFKSLIIIWSVPLSSTLSPPISVHVSS